MDPLASMMVSAADYRYFGEVLKAAAERHCQGRLVALHEGGYSEMYVPFCGLYFIEALAGEAHLGGCVGVRMSLQREGR